MGLDYPVFFLPLYLFRDQARKRTVKKRTDNYIGRESGFSREKARLPNEKRDDKLFRIDRLLKE